ncbi:MAG: GNAT family N-acetyltransferase [Bacteroidota bacterium]
MNIHITIAKNISDCANDWDTLLPGAHHLKSRHLLAFENAGVYDIENNYVQVFIKDKLIGLLYLQQFCFQHKHLNFGNGSATTAKLIKCFLPAKLPILVCGHLFRINFQGFYFKDAAHRQLVFDAIKLFTKLNVNPAGIIVKDCNEAFVEQSCKFWGYRFFNGDVTMEILKRPAWNIFEDYINNLHKNYRQRAKKIIAAFAGVETKQLNAEEIKNNAALIEQLYWNVVNKQTVKLGTINAAYFYELKKDLQDDFEMYALYAGGKMIGFYTFIFYEKEMETHFIGLDYDANTKHKIYFNILFAGIEKMIERRFEKLELGRTARDAKANAGALPRQVFNYIKVKNPLADFTLRHFLNRFNKAENINLMKRNPLK